MIIAELIEILERQPKTLRIVLDAYEGDYTDASEVRLIFVKKTNRRHEYTGEWLDVNSGSFEKDNSDDKEAVKVLYIG
jgi:hypothetical protein